MRSLILFFEFRSGLIRADQFGLLERNLALFCRLIETGYCDKVYCFTYNPDDRRFLAECWADGRLPEEVDVLTPPRWLAGRIGSIIYSLFGPLIHKGVFSDVTVLHTFQVSGSWAGLIGKICFRRPLLFRCGYPLSVRFKQEGKPINYSLARLVERAMVRFSDHVGVTSQTMKAYYTASGTTQKVTVIPNYVDLAAFAQIPSYDKNRPLLFVGRLAEVKNIANLIIACGQLGHPLHIFGDGPLKAELQGLVIKIGADVTFKGVVPNTELAKLHKNYSIYITCSVREGMPKSVVEAMGSGLIVVGTRTDGVLELVEDGVTGHLIDGYDADAIQSGLASALQNFSPEVGRAACRYVSQHYSLEHATEVTASILTRMEST